MALKRSLSIIAGAALLAAGLLALRQTWARPLPAAGSWRFPRGGPYILGFDAPGPAELLIDGTVVASGAGEVKRRVVYQAGEHTFELRAPAGTRLLWHPPGRRGAPEYVPASVLSPYPPAWRDAAVAAGLLLVVVAAAWLLLRPRPTRLTAGIFVLALALRAFGLGAAGQTWDEDEYWSSGRNYVLNVLDLDFRESSWRWNHEHPPVTKLLAGVGALWTDGYGGARVIFALLGAAACALAAAIGRRLFGERAGLYAGLACALTPHLLAHASIVGHETPTVTFWTLAIWLALRAHDTRAPAAYAWVGIALGLAVATRFISVLLVPVVAVALLVPARRETLVRTAGMGLLIVPSVAVAAFVAVWPLMWHHPRVHLDAAWDVLQQQHLPELYFGHLVQHPPWHYFPVHALVASPLGLLLAGLVLGAVRASRRRERGWLLVAAWVLFPFGVAWSPVRQDGARYLLPALAGLAVAAGAGIDLLGGRLRALAPTLVAYLGLTAAAIHPYYLDYFNEAVGGPAGVQRHRLFDVGWWGEGIDRAVAYINRHAEPGGRVARLVQPIHVTWFRTDLWASLTDRQDSEWLLVNDLWRETFARGFRPPPDAKLVYEVRRLGASLVRVYRREGP